MKQVMNVMVRNMLIACLKHATTVIDLRCAMLYRYIQVNTM